MNMMETKTRPTTGGAWQYREIHHELFQVLPEERNRGPEKRSAGLC